MVADQLVARGLPQGPVLQAMGRVPRERFVPPRQRAEAYDDHPLPIGGGQTISQPYVVALTLIEAGVGPGKRVLDIGTGSGYAAAVAAAAGATVFGIERRADLTRAADQLLQGLGYPVDLICGDGLLGRPEDGPFDAIVAAAAGTELPAAWDEQLSLGGVIVAPVGPAGAQELIRRRRTPHGFETESLLDVSYVPLLPGVVDDHQE